MEETFIKPETAKLAKLKGFDWPVHHYYQGEHAEVQICVPVYNRNHFKNLYSAPTQSLLQKWIREKHGINVLVYTDDTLSFFWQIQSAHPAASYLGNTLYSNNVWCGNYEDCLEDGLLTILKLIP